MAATYHWNSFADSEALASALAGKVSGLLAKAVSERGEELLAVSGGTTPALFFAALSQADIAWDKVTVTLVDGDREVVAWRQHDVPAKEPLLATAPAAPAEINSVDELLLIAQHLVQYRHPTRSPQAYLDRVLELDPADSRAHLALAELAHTSGAYERALAHLDEAAARITQRNLNPRTAIQRAVLGDDVDLRKLNPKSYLQDAILGMDDTDATGGADGSSGSDADPVSMTKPVSRPAAPPLGRDERAPFDSDAT